MAYLEMIDIVKRFPGVLANDHVHLAVEYGEIHALMGENGAGKSTLMSILYGLQTPDEGYVRLSGSTLFLNSPLDAIANGIGMVHQAFKLFESLTVWENIVYRCEPRRGLFVDGARARAQVADLAARHGLPIDPKARVADLPVGGRQRLEILKALYRNARVLILDEPTAVLTPAEVATLFKVMKSLAASGCTVLLVTHKIERSIGGQRSDHGVTRRSRGRTLGHRRHQRGCHRARHDRPPHRRPRPASTHTRQREIASPWPRGR